MIIVVSPPQKFRGEAVVPGDKSISHRAAILGALARGITEVDGFPESGDCLSTLNCLKQLGVELSLQNGRLRIHGVSNMLRPPNGILDAANSGTTARLLLGVLAGQDFTAQVTGDESLRKRPMQRVVEPLKLMGASFQGGSRLPLTVRGGRLRPLQYTMPVASAQVKSALLLAGLSAGGVTSVEEPCPSRNHTELMLGQFGIPVRIEGGGVSVTGGSTPRGCRVRVPGDISAAAFFLVAAAAIPGAELTVRNVGVNPTRSGIVETLREMGAKIEPVRTRFWGAEPVADLKVSGGDRLRGVDIGGEMIPRIIDEIPALAVAAATARGVTRIMDAGELRVKESDRIAVLCRQLTRMGAIIEELPDGMLIKGGSLRGAAVESCGDHRVAMSLAIAGLLAAGDTSVRNASVIGISFPGFMASLRLLVQYK